MTFARPKLKVHPRGTTGASYSPAQVAAAYDFPASFVGKGQAIAIPEFGGAFSAADFAAFCQRKGISPLPAIEHVYVGGASQQPDPQGADVEVALDCQVVAGAAPGVSKIRFVWGNNSGQAFADVFNAISQMPDVCAVSLSWGGPEDQWSAADRTAVDAALHACATAGISVEVAAGDNGSSDGEFGHHVDYPASSPYACGCGGTRLMLAGGVRASEVVWNDGRRGGATGGGVSAVYPRPDFQAQARPKARWRGVPDLAGNADPATGYSVISGGQEIVVGGTSAVAPLMAALVARLTQAIGRKLGFLPPLFYPLMVSCFYDVTQGNNGVFVARTGWDACTGCGVPDGTKLLAALQAPFKKREGGPGVGMPAGLLLHEFGSQVWAAFGHPPYLVGSALAGKEWRDVDVRLILPDEEYERMGLGDPRHPHQNARWVALVLAFSALGKQITGLPIDFQIQQQTAANKEHDGPRSALGIVALRLSGG